MSLFASLARLFRGSPSALPPKAEGEDPRVEVAESIEDPTSDPFHPPPPGMVRLAQGRIDLSRGSDQAEADLERLVAEAADRLARLRPTH